MATNRVSLVPSTFTQGGGLIDDLDVEITRARFMLYDYEGKSDEPGLVLGMTLRDQDGNEHFQAYSAGDKAYFVPSEDPKNEDASGLYLVPVSDRSQLNGGTNAALLLKSMVEAGVPDDLLGSDEGLAALEGLGVHVNRQPQPKRSNLPKRAGQDDSREKTILLVTRVNYLPGGSPAAPTTKAAPGKPSGKPAAAATKAAPAKVAPAKPAGKPVAPAAPAAPEADSLVEELQGHLVSAFAATGLESMKKSQIATNLFKVIEKADPNRNKLLQMAGKDEVLTQLDGFTFDGTSLSMG